MDRVYFRLQGGHLLGQGKAQGREVLLQIFGFDIPVLQFVLLAAFDDLMQIVDFVTQLDDPLINICTVI